jgi:serine/threonine protein kinase
VASHAAEAWPGAGAAEAWPGEQAAQTTRRGRQSGDEALPSVEQRAADEPRNLLAVGAYRCHGEALGVGSFGLVFRATHQVTGRCVAIKIFKNAESAEAAREISVHQQIQACGSARRLFSDLLEWCTEAPVQWMAIALAGSSLSQHIRAHGPLSRPAVEAVAAQMVLALGCLHHLRLVHLDVKPSNILWLATDNSARLTDFGTCESVPVPEIRPLEYSTYCSEPYRPPEIWCAASDHMLRRALSPAVDVWGLGCVVFEALTGKTLMQHQQGAWQVAVRDCVAARSSARGADSCRVRVSRHLQRVPRDWQAMILACCMAVPAARPALDADDGMAWVLERRGGQPRL